MSMTLAERLAGGETLFTAWSSVPDALTVEIVAGQGFDAVTLDMQHGGHH
ncbi:MAG: 2,4-dihydroxyhept-2-ene-1,7-dioic acid aldolase, partial [Nitratireductor sp.]